MHVSKLTKAQQWLAMLFQRPTEAYDRFLTVLEVKADTWFQKPPDYAPIPLSMVYKGLEQTLGVDLDPILEASKILEEEVIQDIQDISEHSPIHLSHFGDFALARLCYLACRTLKPKTVLETGVATGVTSRFILAALEENREGTLHSIDLPPLGPNVEDYIGILVPEALKHRWHLHRGVTKRIMPDLLPQIKPVDVFVHDSLHTYRNILRELDLVTPFLNGTAAIIADDIDENPAFFEWSNRTKTTFAATAQEEVKQRLLGLALMTNADSSGS